jgi:glycosyltransferase involved in cell wall biosynthesis
MKNILILSRPLETKISKSGADTWINLFKERINIIDKNINIITTSKGDLLEYIYENNIVVLIINTYIPSEMQNNEYLIKIKQKCKLYFVIHNDIYFIAKFIEKYKSYVDGIISISNNIHEKYRKLIDNSLLLPNYAKYVKRLYEPIKNTLLTIGRISEEKNICMMISVIKVVKSQIPNIQYTIVGNGSQYLINQYLKLVKYNNVELNVKFANSESNVDTLNKIYQENEIVVLPSVIEGMPYTILESLCNNTKVVASNVGGTSEFVSYFNNSFLFDFNTNFSKYNDMYYIDDIKALLLDIGYVKYNLSDKLITVDEMLHTCGLCIENYYINISIKYYPPYLFDHQEKKCILCKHLENKKIIWNENVDIIAKKIIEILNISMPDTYNVINEYDINNIKYYETLCNKFL